MKKKSKRGGARAGAGRPRGKVQRRNTTYRILPETALTVRARAATAGISQAKLLEKIFSENNRSV
jgi:hypothetical protein